MFRRALILSSLLTLGALALTLYNYATLRPSDLVKYNRSKTERVPRALERQPTLQKRQGVRKDFWIPKEGQRNHLTIASETSELILIDRNGKIEATELLQNLDGQMTEEGELRRFKAMEGTYFYPSHRFIGKGAEFSLFKEGDPTPFLLGKAERANFSFLSKSPLLTAEQVEIQSGAAFRALGDTAVYSAPPGGQGTLEIKPSCRMEMPGASLQCEGPLTLHLEEQMAETPLPFHYEDGQCRIDANEGKLLYGQGEDHRMAPQTIQCEGSVRLASEENYALADELVYFPETQTLHLFAKESNRVLFWKSDGSIQISAPKIEAHLAESEEIKGIGDVHFTFDLEEEHRIETLFGKYLQ